MHNNRTFNVYQTFCTVEVVDGYDGATLPFSIGRLSLVSVPMPTLLEPTVDPCPGSGGSLDSEDELLAACGSCLYGAEPGP